MKYYTNRAPKPQYDRYDICAAHLLIEHDYNIGGIVMERKSNKRRMMSAGYQLNRMQYRPGLATKRGFVNDNTRGIYKYNVRKLGLGIKPKIYSTNKSRLDRQRKIYKYMQGFRQSKITNRYNIKYYSPDYDLIR